MRGADIALIVYDVTSKETAETVSYWVEELRQSGEELGALMFVQFVVFVFTSFVVFFPPLVVFSHQITVVCVVANKIDAPASEREVNNLTDFECFCC
jgi:GTPase SAR1 family protein